MVNIIGFLGYAFLVVGGVGCGLYAIKWLLGKVNRGRDIY